MDFSFYNMVGYKMGLYFWIEESNSYIYFFKLLKKHIKFNKLSGIILV